MIAVQIQTVETRPTGFTIREWRKIVKATLSAMAERWHSKYAPKHFQRGAAQRYGYRPRNRAYKKRKRNEARVGKIDRRAETNDLIYTGDLERAVLHFPEIKATEGRATVQMAAPSYVPARPPRRNSPWMAAEITATIESEVNDLSHVGDVTMTDEINTSKAPTIKTVAA